MIRVDDRDGVKWFVVTDENGQEVEWVPGRFGVLIAHEVEQLQQRLAAAEAFVAKHKCGKCGGVRVTEQELCKCTEAAKGGRDE